MNKTKHGLVSGIYCAFTVSGIIAASIIAAICNKMGPEYFRIAYALSFILALFTYKMRTTLKETPEYLKCNKDRSPRHSFKKKYVLSIVVASLFFGVMYGLPTKIFNVLLPIAIGVHSDQIVILNIASLILYMGLLILAGLLSEKYGAKTMIRIAAAITSIVAYPLMVLIQSGYWLYIIGAKIIFTMLTAAFMGPFHSWAQQLSPPNSRYKNISTSYTIGKCFSTILLSCSFLIYEYFQHITILGVILSLIAIITTRIFYESATQEEFEMLPRD